MELRLVSARDSDKRLLDEINSEAFMAFAAHLHLTFSDTVPKFYRKD